MKPIHNPQSAIRNRTIYPVILAVPKTAQALTPKERVKFLSQHARRALEQSAQKSNVRLDTLAQDERNAPLPFDGTYWSVTHKNEYVGGVVCPSPTGIDIEKICPRAKSLFRKTADEAEWALADTTLTTFFRYWTAKEAVLKAAGIGLRDLSKCRISRVLRTDHLNVEYDGNQWQIEHHFFNSHIASIVKNEFVIEWTIC
ncbi:MAG: 4'-phosphopantetheinyl transferase superfamily protein [Desulfobacterales bacterium]|jgi:4'-phosphopantetheinyl transferase